jgi:uncharacterized membrane protein
MLNTVEEYLAALRTELAGSDKATVQDAAADAEDHLRTAITNLQENETELVESEALRLAIEQYGTPAETAAAYIEVERRTSPGLTRAPERRHRSILGRFFGIYADSRAWGALLYMLISLVTGIIYFTWGTMGISISVSFSLFIFGLPLAIFFLFSLRGFALLEGRIVEALLGVRMPRRPLFSPRKMKWFERLKVQLLDRHTWQVIIYLLLQLPLGVFYFCLTVIVFTFALSGIAIPILQGVFNLPVANINGVFYYVQSQAYPLLILLGFLLWTIYMHLAKFIGKLHGRYAKAMLVSDKD